jgi:hypothetical protein
VAQRCFPIDSWSRFVIEGILGMVPFGVMVLMLEPEVRRMSTHILRKWLAQLSSVLVGRNAETEAETEGLSKTQADVLPIVSPASAIEK